ncbi:CAP domain-containing protein [Streptomyces genisteinicus]|uniref:CAP domain-containing protein n=1 Tax=Streptomyces genisteinicus TaxID=2768068 RepID=A0A7H0I035_9ACTN|nr:CAP domain-containing protein [Streptomyces genisteinicus]QNP66151.1 CAP domain-containing protein [Streptomyces genisteinicus]
MSSHRAGRRSRSRSHARPKGGHARNAVLTLGAFTVAAGVGATLFPQGQGDGAADSVAADAPDVSTATGPQGGALPRPAGTPTASASPSASPLPSATPSPRPDRSASEQAREAAAREAAAKAAARKASATPSRAPATTGAGEGSGGGSGDGGSPGSGSGSGSGSGAASNGAEAQVLALVNKERAAAGCGPVTANARLTQAADDYSDVMAASGVMSHTGPDGSTMTSRVEAAGYAWSTLGENIARGQADAEAVMDAWMNSPGHRANILNCSFDELGVGVHMGDGGPWWTQNFGAGR